VVGEGAALYYAIIKDTSVICLVQWHPVSLESATSVVATDVLSCNVADRLPSNFSEEL